MEWVVNPAYMDKTSETPKPIIVLNKCPYQYKDCNRSTDTDIQIHANECKHRAIHTCIGVKLNLWKYGGYLYCQIFHSISIQYDFNVLKHLFPFLDAIGVEQLMKLKII